MRGSGSGPAATAARSGDDLSHFYPAAVIDHFAPVGAGEAASAAELRQIAASRLHKLDGSGSTMSAHLRPRLAMLKAAPEAVIDLCDRGEIGDEVMRQLESEFDHEEILLRQR